MARNGYLVLIKIAVIVAVIVARIVPVIVAVNVAVFSLSPGCQRCSMVAPSGTFCSDTFDEFAVNRSLTVFSVVECLRRGRSIYSGPPSDLQSHQKPVCRKTKELFNNKDVFRTSCYWDSVWYPIRENECFNINASYIKAEICEPCSTGDCNGKAMVEKVGLDSAAVQCAPFALIVLIVGAIANIFF